MLGIVLLPLRRLQAVQPPDTLAFSQKTYTNHWGTCTTLDNDTACVSIRLQYPDFEPDSLKPITDTLAQYVQKRMFEPVLEHYPTDTGNDIFDQLVLDYEDVLAQFPEYSHPWRLERTMEVIFNRDKFITLKFREFTSLGGAHPNTWVYYRSYRREDCRSIQLSDLLIDHSKARLVSVAEQIFRDQKNMRPEERYDDLDIWFENDRFHLTDNFGITPEGLLFYYNNYEIAPYSEGPTSLLIPYYKIRDLLKVQPS